MDLSLPRSPERDWAYDFVHAAKVLDALDGMEPFDIVHNHTPAMIPFLARARAPHVTTVHGDTRRAPADHIYASYPRGPYVAVSRSQQTKALPGLRWHGRVKLGLDLSQFAPDEFGERGEYLLHVGSLGRRKGTLDAIRLAKAVGRPLVIIGTWDPRDKEYCERHIMPFMRDPQISFLGERGDIEKVAWLRRAAALVHPLAWDEPFGLIMLEALACGAPVLALDRGAASELIQHGRNGFLAAHWSELIVPARDAAEFKSDVCRESVLEYTVDSMVDSYLAIYRQLADE